MIKNKFKFKKGLPCEASAKWGMTLFISVVIMGILLFISFAVINITMKASLFASSGRDSQYAFYAADAGLECALYWDTKVDPSKFDTSAPPGGSIECGGVSIQDGVQTVPGSARLTQIGGGGTVLNQTVSEGGTASLSCSSGTISSYTSTYGKDSGGGGGTCPVSCGTCTTGSNSCSVTYNNANCGDCNSGWVKNGDLSVTCSSGGAGLPSIFYFDMNSGSNPVPYCAIVTVEKRVSDGKTYIKSKGYNTCDTGNPRRVERGIEVDY